MTSERLKSRLHTVKGILEMIDRRRMETGLPNLGSAMERRILDAEMSDLELSIALQTESEQAAGWRSRAVSPQIAAPEDEF